MYQYDPEMYRRLHDEKVAELRRDYQGEHGRRRSRVGRFMESVRSVRLQWRFAAARTYLPRMSSQVRVLDGPQHRNDA